ncbi:NUDIX hydrolase [Phaeobacter gallaeciensis]|uniref:NAD(+) diphosphatase n=1 Tax=Phaeobacter gallaeciensis TaxID=60890 RepID=A0A1B0ZQC8_9RHOB|nr:MULTISPECIES: NAD(+) diphosphatase [Phaeobacter]MDF1772240.1 NAD(+) diphosphatase [Pseudophaeobacter sp. bin_em_oilr2.035]ANP36298.1 NUDIX hydrolase [Phaeobacter gallaeciensis]MDE4060770.1 NAD(+) diphosphatase [Phaeobacter gallaeciensis]MDE4123803.1 NAD(+) diphosphatase [Phaeobacter gallaeciensis]MDE4128259.1 NAD(+) diphosphatase [Phaeobacter gallaeciensis]
MKRAEEVTFGGKGGLDRSAHLRADAEALDAAWGAQNAQVLMMWRGKPLCQRSDPERGPDALAWISTTHPVAAECRDAALFLGLLPDQSPAFACDISSWQPDALDEMALASFADVTEQQHPDLPSGYAFAELRRVMTRLTPLEAELAATAKALFSWHGSHGFCARCGHPSDMVQAGWQRNCPSCKASHFPRTDPVVIMLITHGDEVLMGRSPGWPEGMYSLLAGFVEPGETLEAAVRREVLEESGVKVGEVEYLSSQPWPFPMSLMFGCHGIALDRELTIDPHEIEDAIWVSKQDMMTAFAGEHPILKPARKGAIAHFLLQNWLADTLD